MWNLCSLGFVYGVLASICMGSFHLVCSQLVKHAEVFVILIVAYGLFVVILLIYIILSKKSLKPVNGEYLAVISHTFFHGITANLINSSLQYISPFEATVIADTRLLLIALISFLYLNEPLDFIDLIFIVISFFGVCIWCKPELFFQTYHNISSKQIYGFGLASGAALCFAMMAITNRKCIETNPTSIVMYSGVNSVIMTIIFHVNTLKINDFNINMLVLLTLCASSLLLLSGHLLLVKAFQLEEATYVAFGANIELVWTILGQTFIFNETLERTRAVGISLIALGFLFYLVKKIIFLKFDIKSHKCCFKREISDSSYESVE